MGVDLSALERMMSKAVKHFWKARMLAAESQKKRGLADQGNRSGVTAGEFRTASELTGPHRFAAALAGKIAAIAAE